MPRSNNIPMGSFLLYTSSHYNTPHTCSHSKGHSYYYYIRNSCSHNRKYTFHLHQDSESVGAREGTIYLEQLNPVGIQEDLEIATIRLIGLLNVGRHLTQEGLLYPPLDHPGILLVCVYVQVSGDDGSADAAGGIDDLLDPRHAEGDMCWHTSQGLNPLNILLLEAPIFILLHAQLQ